METYQDLAHFIFSREARFDRNGNLAIYTLPPSDGGGTYEVAGINDGYHPEMAQKLRILVQRGEFAVAAREAKAYFLRQIDPVLYLHPDRRVNLYMGDLAFNRGVTGAKKIAQEAMRTADRYTGKIDGDWGPKSQAGFAKIPAEDLVPRLLVAWTWYERTVMKRDERHAFWPGLVNRRLAALQFALGARIQEPK